MRRALACALLLLIALSPTALAASPSDREVRTISEQFDASGYEGVQLDVSVGEVRVEGTDSSLIVAEVRVLCDRHRDLDDCRERAERIELLSRERRGRLVLEVEGWGTWRSRGTHLEVVLEVPAELPFELELGIGEADLVDLRSDVTVDMGIGEISVRMDEEVVGTVRLDNGIGETYLGHREGKQEVAGIMGGTDVVWNQGPGPHEVIVDLNIGEIDVRLR